MTTETTTHRIQKAVSKLRSDMRLAEERAATHPLIDRQAYYQGRAAAIKRALAIVQMVMDENARLRESNAASQDRMAELMEQVELAFSHAKKTREEIKRGTPQ